MTSSVRVLRNDLPRIAAGMVPLADKAVRKAAMDIEGHAKARAPVDTGALANSIQAAKVADLWWRVYVGVEYGAYVEFGTRFAAAQPYLLPAVRIVAPGFTAAMAALGRR